MCSSKLTKYWLEHYCDHVCTLCGNSGILDTRGTQNPAGKAVGKLNYCFCPNGQTLRKHQVTLQEQKTSQSNLLKTALDALNQIPRHKLAGPFEDSYDLAQAIGDYLKERT